MGRRSTMDDVEAEGAQEDDEESEQAAKQRETELKNAVGVSSERIWLRKIVKSGWFNAFIYLVIAANTLIIALDDTWVERDQGSAIGELSVIADWVILGIFTVEMILKMVAFGLRFKPPQDPDEDAELYGYFALMWNRFDCFIVVMSWILTPIALFSGADISRLVRILRLTRPLRAVRQIKSFQGTQELLACIPMSLPSIFDVLNLLIFCLLVFGILGLNLFGLEGKFHGRCVVDSRGNSTAQTAGYLALPSPSLCGEGWGCGEGFRCSCQPRVADDLTIEARPYAYTDTVTGDIGCMRQGSSRPWAEGSITDRPVCPNFGFSCFDNFAIAVFTCFSSITLDSWSQTMWWAQDSLSPAGGWIFFVLLILLVSFNVINLFVASMSNAYREVRGRRIDAERLQAVEAKRRENKIKRALLMNEITEAQAAREMAKSKVDKGNQGLLNSILDSERWTVSSHRNTMPLNPIALLFRKLTVYPQRVDESGNVVARLALRLARERNIDIKWGPGHGRWTLVAKPGGVRTVIKEEEEKEEEHVSKRVKSKHQTDKETRAKAKKEEEEEDEGVRRQSTYRGGAVIESGFSTGEARRELKEALLKFQRVFDAGSKAINEEESTPLLDMFILICILLNTATAAVDHFSGEAVQTNVPYPPDANCCNAYCSIRSEERCPKGLIKMQPGWYDFNFYAEAIFNGIFTVEMFFKIVSFWSLRGFLRSQFPSNVIDLSIVIISDVFFVLDIFLPKIFNVAIFRLIRLLRALRLASRLRRLRLLIQKTQRAAKTVIFVLFLMLFFHMISALVAMQLFRCVPYEESICRPLVDTETIAPGQTAPSNVTVCPEHCSLLQGSPERCVYNDDEIFEHCPWDKYANFDSFGTSIMQLFYITTGDNNWVTTLSSAMRSNPTGWPGLFFILPFYAISVYMIVNLFVCVILEEFELTDEQKEGLQVGQFRVKKIRAILQKQERFQAQRAKARAAGKKLPHMDFNIGAFLAGDYEAITDVVARFIEKENLEDEDNDRDDDPVDIFFCITRPLPDRHIPNAPRNLRWYVHYIFNSRAFTAFILLTIIASSIMLALDTPLRSANILNSSVEDGSLRIADYVFLAIFSVEFVLKILLHGVYWEHKEAYFRQGWNLLDFVILGLQVLDVSGIEGLKTLRVLRVLRPLRLLNKIQSLQLILMALWKSATDIINVMLLWLFGFVAFGVVGMYLFGGKLYSCNDAAFVGPPLNADQPPGSLIGWRENCAGNYFAFETSNGESYVSRWSPTGILKPRVWSNPRGWDFDNFANAMQTMFEASTLRHWSFYVIACSDATSIGQQPIPNYDRGMVIFFMAWVVLSCFFLLQMVIGVLVDAINQETGTALYTYLQRNWIRTEAKILKLQPLTPLKIPRSPIRGFVWMVVNHPTFQNAITLIIIINIILMATESYNQPDYWSNTMTALNWVFIAIYVFEITLKIIAYSWKFFLDPWNLFDLGVVLASIVDEIISTGGGGGSGLQALRVLRILRVARAFRLVRRNPRLRLILNTLVASVPSILSIFVFMALYIFLFAKIANQFFSGLKFGLRLNRRNNFDTTWEAMLTMFVVVTGDKWQLAMRDVAVQGVECTPFEEVQRLRDAGLNVYFPDPLMDKGDCGTSIGAYLFFNIFFLFGYYVLRSAFIAVLMENFFAFKVNGGFMIADPHLVSYQRLWRDYDPEAEGKLPMWKMREFLSKLARDNNPLGATVLQNEFKYQAFRMEMTWKKPREETEHVFFTPLLHTLGMHTVGPKAFQYEEMLARLDKLTFFGQLAACEKMVAIYRGMKDRKMKNAKAMGLVTSGALKAITVDSSAVDRDAQDQHQEIGAEALVRAYRSKAGKAHKVERLEMLENHPSMVDEEGKAKQVKRSFKPPVPKSTVSESSLARLATLELDKHCASLEALISKSKGGGGMNGTGSGHGDGMNGNGMNGNGTNGHSEH